MVTTKHKRLIAVLVVALLAIGAMMGLAVRDVAHAEQSFVADADAASTLVVAQITDTHYYPFSFTSNSEPFKDVMVTGTKLLAESSFMLRDGLKKLAEKDAADLPDVLLVTGDITLNGELQAHVEVSNLLRQMQNKVRQKKPNFQVLVSPGNHDLYNPKAYRYDVAGLEGQTVHSANVSRKLFTQIYAGLGYPSMTDSEMQAFYDSLPAYLAAFTADSAEPDRTGKVPVDTATAIEEVDDHFYPGTFVNSPIASALDIEYQYMDGAAVAQWQAQNPDWYLAEYPALDAQNFALQDFGNGEITYVVNTDKKFVLVGIDDELDSHVIGHHVGGTIFDSTFAWLEGGTTAAADPNKTLVGFAHHNLVPHFELEQSLLKDFTMNEWAECADRLADMGMRFIFTGHMHSNDLNQHTALSGDRLIDCETSSFTGYQAGMRFIKIERGTLGSSYAENYYSKLDKLTQVDVTKLFTDLDRLFYLGGDADSYLNSGELTPYISQSGSTYYITDAGEYAVTKLFRNIVDLYVGRYVNTDFLNGAGAFVANLLPSTGTAANLLSMFGLDKQNVGLLIDNLIRHVETVTLKDYHYSGDDPQFTQDKLGAKLGGYASELVDRIVNLPVNSYGDTFAEFALTGYLTHVGGLDEAYSQVDAAKKEAFARLYDGSIVHDLLDILLDRERGLYPIVKALLSDEIDLAAGLPEATRNALEGVLNIFVPGIDLSRFCLQDAAVPLVGVAGPFLGLDIDLKSLTDGKDLMTFLDEVLEEYVTDSLYTGVGEIAGDIMFQFYVDQSGDAMTGEYEVLFDDVGATYVQGKMQPAPSVDNGMLPGMLDVNFGEEPTTQKNFVWFTDRRITGTQLQYVEGETFDERTATQVTGSFEAFVTTTASIDLGVYCTLMNTQVGRHTVSLQGLKPGTTYSYRVGSREGALWSDVYTFTTASEAGDFQALLISDLQGSARQTYEKAAEALQGAAGVFEGGYDFVINSGDAVDNSRNALQYRYMRNGAMASFWGNTTEVFAFGNHDKYTFTYEPDVYVQDRSRESSPYTHPYFHDLPTDVNRQERNYASLYYNLAAAPDGVSNSGVYYSFDYSDVHFTVLNTNDIDTRNRLSEHQLDWLTADLDAAAGAAYRVVILHKGLYGSGSHITDKDVVGLREQLTPVFAEKKVSLVIQGHDHTYSESYLLDGEGNTVGTPGKKTALGEGTLYVTLGTMGDKFYRFQGSEDIPIAYGEQLHGEKGLDNPTFGKLTYEDGQLYYEGFQYDMDKDQVRSVYDTVDYALLLWVGVALAALLLIGVVVAIVCDVANQKRF